MRWQLAKSAMHPEPLVSLPRQYPNREDYSLTQEKKERIVPRSTSASRAPRRAHHLVRDLLVSELPLKSKAVPQSIRPCPAPRRAHHAIMVRDTQIAVAKNHLNSVHWKKSTMFIEILMAHIRILRCSHTRQHNTHTTLTLHMTLLMTHHRELRCINSRKSMLN